MECPEDGFVTQKWTWNWANNTHEQRPVEATRKHDILHQQCLKFNKTTEPIIHKGFYTPLPVMMCPGKPCDLKIFKRYLMCTSNTSISDCELIFVELYRYIRYRSNMIQSCFSSHQRNPFSLFEIFEGIEGSVSWTHSAMGCSIMFHPAMGRRQTSEASNMLGMP